MGNDLLGFCGWLFLLLPPGRFGRRLIVAHTPPPPPPFCPTYSSHQPIAFAALLDAVISAPSAAETAGDIRWRGLVGVFYVLLASAVSRACISYANHHDEVVGKSVKNALVALLYNKVRWGREA